MITDWNYLLEARKGDQEASKKLFYKYNKLLIRMTFLITGSLDSAKDIAQESFIRVLNRKIKHNDGNFKAFITTIAYRLALKEKYRFQKNQRLNSDDYSDNKPSPLEIQISDEQQRYLYKTITKLPDKQKEILVLRLYGEHSYETIAEIMNLPIGTVKSRIFYAVKSCKNDLKENGVLE